MEIGVNSNQGEEKIISFRIRTKQPEKIVVRVRDAYKPFTYYIDRTDTISGNKGEIYYLRMPQCPQVGVISVFNERTGNTENDNSFQIDSLISKPLNKSLNVFNSRNRLTTNFIKFAQTFAERCGILSASLPDGASVYLSDDGKFEIRYVDEIYDTNDEIPEFVNGRETGRLIANPNYMLPITTPSRINRQTGIIDVAKKYFLKSTVPMRMAILLHEFSHFYINNVPTDEIEADLNALTIYLSMGYPRREAYHAFLEVFKDAYSQQNVERYSILKKFIDDFENKKYNILP